MIEIVFPKNENYLQNKKNTNNYFEKVFFCHFIFFDMLDSNLVDNVYTFFECFLTFLIIFTPIFLVIINFVAEN